MKARTDTRLVEAARGGDQDAFAELFERYERRIFTYAYGIVGNAEDASDVTQDAFIRVFEAIPRSARDIDFKPYLYRTAHNAAIDLVRAGTRFVAADALDLEPERAVQADPERVALLREQQEQTWRAVFALSEKQRAVLALREMEELSYQQIAEVLEMPRNTVGVMLSRARLGFKEAFRMSSVRTDEIARECEAMLPLLSAYIDEELTAEERRDVDAHLADCAFCRLALDEMREASRSYRALLPLLPPPEIAEAAMRRAAEGLAPGPEAARSTRVSRAARTAIALSVTGGVLLGGLATYLALDALRDEGPAAPPELGLEALGESDGADGTRGAVAEGEPIFDGEGPDTGPTPLAAAPSDDGETEPTAEAAEDTVAPPTPRQVSPEDGANVTGSSVDLVWSRVDDPSGVFYRAETEVYDHTSGMWTAGARSELLETTSWAYTIEGLLVRWRVVAIDGARNESAPSEWRTLSRVLDLTPLRPYEPEAPY